MNRSTINTILGSAGLRPQHKFGQNFMIDQNILAAIVEAGDILPSDIVLEIGPGVGNLTQLLAQRAAHVLAVDIDHKLLPAAMAYHELPNVTWLLGDALAGKHALNPEMIAALHTLRERYPIAACKLVSNLPYNAASPLIAELLVWTQQQRVASRDATGAAPPPIFSRLTFTVQYEVGVRMSAPPGSRDYGPLGILIQLLADVEIERKIPPKAFWPPPKINSALVIVEPSIEKMDRVSDPIALQRLLSSLFAHRRQTIHNALRHTLQDAAPADLLERLATLGINPKDRPEMLTPDQFRQLADAARSW
jgi:16S rRNA (adenine1518-N6/adenine1519-N6)-dimethyltransferase